MPGARRLIHPPSRPDGTVFRTGRAGAPPREWGLLPIDRAEVRRLRYASGLRSQSELADLLSSRAHTVAQSEISLIESVTCWANHAYIARLADALKVDFDVLIDYAILYPESEEQHARQEPV